MPDKTRSSPPGDVEEARDERRFRLLAESIPQIVWTARPDGHRDYQNRRWLDYTGMTPEESSGSGWMDAVHPDDMERCQPTWAGISGTSLGFEWEGRLRRCDGVYRWFLTRANPILDDEGKVVRWFGTSTDVDDHKRFDDERRRRDDERLKLAATAARLGYWDWDIASDTISWSESLEEISGTTPESFGLTLANFLGLVHPDDRDRVREAVRVAVERGTTYEEEFRLANPDGTYRWGLVKGKAYRDRQGRAVRLSGIEVDITRRKQAEDLLLESRQIERRLADHSPAELYILDLVDRNVPFRRGKPLVALGHAEGPTPMSLDEVSSRLMHPDDDARFSAHLDELGRAADGVDLSFEYRMRHADGSYRWFLSQDTVLERDATGAPRLILGAALDINDRKRWQDELRSSEERFRATFDNAAVGIALVGLDGRWVRVNDRLCAIVGRDREELMGLSFQDITHPDDLDADLGQVARMIAGEITTYSTEKRYFRGDGSVTWADLTVSMLRDDSGRPESFISVVRDINDRKSIAERFELGLRVGGLAIAEVDYLEDTIKLEPEARELFGLGDDREVVSRDAIHAMIHPDDRDELARQIARAYEPAGAGWFSMVHRIVRPDGEVRWLSVRKQVSFGHTGDGVLRPIRSLLAMRDVTEARRAEESLKDADRRKDEFLAMLAHEFRTPLAAIKNCLRLLRSPGLSDEDGEESVDIAERQTQTLVRLTDDLLDVSRISTGKIQLKATRLDAAEVVERAAKSVRVLIDQRRHDLTVSVEGRPMPIEGDPTRLEQVLINLLNNAAKYTNEGGRIWLEAGVEGPEVVFRVRDSGIGLEPAMLAKVFDLFEQVDASIDRAQGGLGIGLTLVKTLAEMHGGGVSAASEGHGMGSEFSVRLPLLALDEPPDAAVGDGPAGGAAGVDRRRRILLVDDSPDTLRSMARLLEVSGHEVFKAGDGPSALEAAAAHQPDVVILDIGLPGMSGYEVAEALGRGGKARPILIALSGYAQESDRERSRQAGFEHHLSKPVDLDALLGLIDPLPRPGRMP